MMIELPIVISVDNGDPRESFGTINDESIINMWYGEDGDDLKETQSLIAERGSFNVNLIGAVYGGRITSVTDLYINGRLSLVLKPYCSVMEIINEAVETEFKKPVFRR